MNPPIQRASAVRSPIGWPLTVVSRAPPWPICINLMTKASKVTGSATLHTCMARAGACSRLNAGGRIVKYSAVSINSTVRRRNSRSAAADGPEAEIRRDQCSTPNAVAVSARQISTCCNKSTMIARGDVTTHRFGPLKSQCTARSPGSRSTFGTAHAPRPTSSTKGSSATRSPPGICSRGVDRSTSIADERVVPWINAPRCATTCAPQNPIT